MSYFFFSGAGWTSVRRVAAPGLVIAALFATACSSGSSDNGSGGASGSSGSSGAAGGGASGSAGSGATGGASGSGGFSGTGGTAGVDSGVDAAAGSDAGPDAADAAPDQSEASAGASGTAGAAGTGGGAAGSDAGGSTGVDCGGSPCTRANATPKCVGSSCLIGSCNASHGDCNATDADGCETNLSNDPDNCGVCGHRCVTQNGTASCVNGACAVAKCDAGFTDCNGDASDGCETNTAFDPQNCKTCGNACVPTPGAQAQCTNGVCFEKACAIGFMDCNNNSQDACETNLGNDATNCGYCGNTCKIPHASAKCNGGKCLVDQCDTGWANCDGNGANGCETQLDSDSQNCGACGRACVTSGTSSATCIAGACYAVCDAGAGDCSHPTAPTADDGCETATGTDPDNCGLCGNVCSVPSGTPGCSAGVCTIANCPADTGDCDGDVQNGCETDLLTDADHCGSCARACSGTNTTARACAAGLCKPTCATGFDSCSSPASPAADDGCEADVSSDVDNCGGCGRACSGDNVASKACDSGKCTSSCLPGFDNCLQYAAPFGDDGCETQTNTATQCGSCHNDCTQQGGGGSGLKCGATINVCGCAGNGGRCHISGAGGTCNANDLCECNGTTCQAGEGCMSVGGTDTCTCNGGSACSAGQTCCQTPAGCADLSTDAASCGACGHACPPGFTCASGSCTCSGDASCNGGSAGTCAPGSGVCSCGGTSCAPGQRCQADGSCG